MEFHHQKYGLHIKKLWNKKMVTQKQQICNLETKQQKAGTDTMLKCNFITMKFMILSMEKIYT